MKSIRLILGLGLLASGATMWGCRTGGEEPSQASFAAGQKAAEAGPAGAVLIPAGEFVMGRDGGEDHSPAHKVHVDAFYLDRHEVTNAQYFKFCEETGGALPSFWGMKKYHCGPDFPDHPVVGVSWFQARAYADWAGKRLPTEAEWEYAGRGGLVGEEYPHGSALDASLANYTVGGVMKGSVPVGSYPPNGFGLHDMAGNVVEWVADYYDDDYYAHSPKRNPPGPEEGKFRVIRGGGWHSGAYCNRVYFRNGLFPTWQDMNVGFRCAQDVQ